MPIRHVVIEHLEPVLSRWALVEYRHAARIAGDLLLITNVRDPAERELLSGFCRVEGRSVAELGVPCERMVVLDPRAPEPLEPEDVKGAELVVVGGIMGDFPPRGRTAELLTSRLPGALMRNLGPGQLSVDGAVYVALQVMRGRRLEELEFVDGVEIRLGKYHVVRLPYRYPVVGGRPLISEELVEYLRHGIEEDEAEAIREGRMRSAAEPRGPSKSLA